MKNYGRTTYLSAYQYLKPSPKESRYVQLALALLAVTLIPAPEEPGRHCSASTYFSIAGAFDSYGFSYLGDLLEPTLLLLLPLPLLYPLLPLESVTSTTYPPPLSPSSFSFRLFFTISAAACLFYILTLSSASDLSLLPDHWHP